MPRKTKLMLWEQEQADARKVREDAFEATIQANPELYRKVKNAVLDAHDAYAEINKKYEPLSQARAAAINLRCSMDRIGLPTEEAIADDLAAMLEKAIRPISVDLAVAADAYDTARHALHEQFPYEGAERRPDGL
jgi:methylthioribose-1-phosphate isomerase